MVVDSPETVTEDAAVSSVSQDSSLHKGPYQRGVNEFLVGNRSSCSQSEEGEEGNLIKATEAATG